MLHNSIVGFTGKSPLTKTLMCFYISFSFFDSACALTADVLVIYVDLSNSSQIRKLKRL